MIARIYLIETYQKKIKTARHEESSMKFLSYQRVIFIYLHNYAPWYSIIHYAFPHYPNRHEVVND